MNEIQSGSNFILISGFSNSLKVHFSCEVNECIGMDRFLQSINK